MSRDDRSAFWDLYSHAYDGIRLSIPYQRLLDALVTALALEPGMSVLDLGCGTGNLEERLGEAAPDASVTGIDGSASMLRRAERKCARFSSVGFVRADLAEPLPFPDASFDRVVANNVLYALPGRADVVAEAARVLRPGGLLVVSDPKADASIGALVRAHFAEIAALPPLHRFAETVKSTVTMPLMGLAPMLLIATSVAAGRRAGDYRFSTEGELEGLLTGFPVVRVASAYARQNWLAVAQSGRAPSESVRASSARSSDSSLPVNDITRS